MRQVCSPVRTVIGGLRQVWVFYGWVTGWWNYAIVGECDERLFCERKQQVLRCDSVVFASVFVFCFLVFYVFATQTVCLFSFS